MLEIATCRRWNAPIHSMNLDAALDGQRPSFEVTNNRSNMEIWCVSLDVGSSSFERCYSHLTDLETVRAQRFKHEGAKHQFIAAHGVLNSVLQSRLEDNYTRIQRKESAHKKPYIELPSGERPIEFNLSHCSDFVAIALSDQPVGIDIELIRPLGDIDGISEQVFTAAEKASLSSQDSQKDQLSLFYKFWTCKEAVMKANGTGFMVDPKMIELTSISEVTPEEATIRWSDAIPHHYVAWSDTVD